LPVFLGGCSSGGGVEFAFESEGTPAELWINGTYAGDTPLILSLEEVSSHFVPDLQEVSASVAEMEDAARAGLTHSGAHIGSGPDGTRVLYADKSEGSDPALLEYVLAYRGEAEDSTTGEVIAGGIRVRVQTPEGRQLKVAGSASRTGWGVSATTYSFVLR